MKISAASDLNTGFQFRLHLWPKHSDKKKLSRQWPINSVKQKENKIINRIWLESMNNLWLKAKHFCHFLCFLFDFGLNLFAYLFGCAHRRQTRWDNSTHDKRSPFLSVSKQHNFLLNYLCLSLFFFVFSLFVWSWPNAIQKDLRQIWNANAWNENI